MRWPGEALTSRQRLPRQRLRLLKSSQQDQMRGQTVEDFGFQQLVAIRARFDDAACAKIVSARRGRTARVHRDLAQQHQRPRQRIIVGRRGVLVQYDCLLRVQQRGGKLPCRPETPRVLAVLFCVL